MHLFFLFHVIVSSLELFLHHPSLSASYFDHQLHLYLLQSPSSLSLSLSLDSVKVDLMMESGNSGSMQSSSGGDDQEFDSSFINAPHHHHFSAAAPPPPPPLQQPPPFLSHQNPNFFDHGGAHYTNTNDNDNDLIWSSRGLRSDSHHAFSNLGNPSRPHPIPADSGAPPPQQPRNPKKRTRASRRAPTTVLTTDTTNFRQMVQEFTGIPAAPFSGGGSPYSRRLDLFSAASALRSASHLDNLYPLRPAAHKILSPFSSPQPQHPLNPTMIDAIIPTATITNPNNDNIGAPSTSNNFHLSGDHRSLFSSIHQQPPSLQPMNFSNLSGFLSRDTGASAEPSRWKSGETARNNEENMVEFGGNNINSGESQNYNLNNNNSIAEKGMENVASSSAAEGTVASWLCHSD